MKKDEILAKLPYTKPFLFVDEIEEVGDQGVRGNFTFRPDLEFYNGHFKENPVTPGVILAECCAQIGLVSYGIYLASKEGMGQATEIALTSVEMDFLLAVYPGEKVVVHSEKIYFRFNKLKCKLRMYNSRQQCVCKGVISGMMKTTANE